MRILSIDPGLSGAWAVIADGRPETCGDMPVYGEGTQRRVMAAALAAHVDAFGPFDLAVVELVGAMPKQGTASTFRFGRAAGAVDATLAVKGVPVEYVAPTVWKRHFRLTGPDKEASRKKAIDLAPHLYAMLDRKRDNGRAEAILIGLYGHAAFGPAGNARAPLLERGDDLHGRGSGPSALTTIAKDQSRVGG